MSHWWSDFRYAWRSLLRRPLFFVTASATLALAIGGNLMIGALLYQRYVAPLPYPGSEQLLVLKTELPRIGVDDGGVAAFDYARWRAVDAVAQSAAFLHSQPTLAGDRSVERVDAGLIEPGLLALLGARMAIGAALAASDEDGVLLLHRTWQREYGADPAIIGRTLRLDGRARVVRGVTAAGFELPGSDVDYLLPLRFSADERARRQWKSHRVLLRLTPGVTAAVALQQIDALEATRRAEHSEDAELFRMSGFTPRLLPLREWLHGELRAPLQMLQWAVLGVLLLACANVAHLQLLRASQRRAELGLRQALGAGRARLARLVFGESLLLAASGSLLGMLLAWLGSQALVLFDLFDVGADFPWRFVALAGLALASACTVFCALPAMLGFWRDTAMALRPGSRVTGAAQSLPLLRRALVIAQTALTVVLLIGAGLLLRSFDRLLDVDPGFDRAGVLTAAMLLPAERRDDPAAMKAIWARSVAAARALPGVTQASVGDSPPFGDSYSLSTYSIDGRPIEAAETPPVAVTRRIGDDYFATLGMPLLQGRALIARDAADGNIVVDQRFATRHFGDATALGQRVLVGDPGEGNAPVTIVGVVGAVRQLALDGEEDHPGIYRHFEASPVPAAYLLLRSELPLSTLVAPLRAALHAVDPEQPLHDILSLQARIDQSLDDRRAPLTLLGAFATVALVLAAIGQYGLVAWSVAQRESELGLRIAIGAQARDIVWLVLRGGAQLTAIGLGVGLLLSLASSRLLDAQLYGIGALDPVTYGGVALLLSLIALLACLIPALRATRVAPAIALRGD
jgi:putative ABC transport system permease protein